MALVVSPVAVLVVAARVVPVERVAPTGLVAVVVAAAQASRLVALDQPVLRVLAVEVAASSLFSETIAG